MKILFSITLLILVTSSYACSCVPVKLIDRVSKADFVATAKILSISPDKKNNNYHDIEIEIQNLYKGEKIVKLKILSWLNSSCSFYTPKNTSWLIFARKNKDGILSFGYCSGSIQMDNKTYYKQYPNAEKNFKKSLDLKLSLLNFLKWNNINPKNEYSISGSFPPGSMKNLKGKIVKDDRFSLFEVTINENLSIQGLKLLKDFDNDDLKIMLPDFIKSNLEIYLPQKQEKIPKETKIILALYYYASEKGNSGFISVYDL